ncbi:hypothetical protein [Ochrobactrum sp. BTU1]|uniref:hypothetical protein n=1 Tax=Ochrobactrum sp. BTU1 TaxID=2840456 RepID=UPI001C052A99|nr:hypothetical protein KMS41_16385 [Ochrobactrum sp. BTU1]
MDEQSTENVESAEGALENKIYVVFNSDGILSATYHSAAYDDPASIIPANAIEIAEDIWRDLYDNQSYRRYVDGLIVEYTPPHTEPVTILPAVTLWERTTATEAAQIEAAMEAQDPRSRNIFRAAQTFRSDHELWPLLEQLATQLFGEERAAELLAA